MLFLWWVIGTSGVSEEQYELESATEMAHKHYTPVNSTLNHITQGERGDTKLLLTERRVANQGYSIQLRWSTMDACSCRVIGSYGRTNSDWLTIVSMLGGSAIRSGDRVFVLLNRYRSVEWSLMACSVAFSFFFLRRTTIRELDREAQEFLSYTSGIGRLVSRLVAIF